MTLNTFRFRIGISLALFLAGPILLSMFGAVLGHIAGFVYALKYGVPLLVLALVLWQAECVRDRLGAIEVKQYPAKVFLLMSILSFGSLATLHNILGKYWDWFSSPLPFVLTMVLAMSAFTLNGYAAQYGKVVRNAWRVIFWISVLVCLKYSAAIAALLLVIPSLSLTALEIGQSIKSFLWPIHYLDNILPIRFAELLYVIFVGAFGTIAYLSKFQWREAKEEMSWYARGSVDPKSL